MPNDKWGYPFIYPTRKWAGITSGPTTGLAYFQSDDITDDSIFNDEGHVTNSGGGQWTMSTSGPDAVQIGRTGTDDSAIGGCDMDFEATEDRGYSYKNIDPRDHELTFAVKFVDSGSDNGFAIEGPTGPHSGSGCCSGFAYKLDIQYNENPTKFRFRKEMYHVSNSDDPKTGVWTTSLIPYKLLGHDDWTGFKFIRYNKKDGRSSGHDSVILEVWINPDPDDDPLNWKLAKRTEDKGGWGDDGDHCNGVKDQVGTWSAQKIRLKSNDESGEFDFKHLSWREVDPLLQFDDDPTDGGSTGGGTDGGSTTPEEVTGVLSIQYDINNYRTSACSPSGSIQFYDSGDDGNAWTFVAETTAGVTRTRIGLRAITSISGLCDQPPLQEADFRFKKTGSPTGTLTVTIRNTNGTLKTTMGTLDVSTLTGTMQLIQFINLSNTYVMVAGDYLLAEYSGGDNSNYVSMAVRNTLVATGGINTKAVYYNTFPTTDVYVESSTREISGKLWN